jgi:hypothetical protein
MATGSFQRFTDEGRIVTAGRLAASGILTVGETYFVKSATDPDYNRFRINAPAGSVETVLSTALARCLNGAGDTVYLCPKYDNSGWTQATDLTFSTNFTKLIGLSAVSWQGPVLLLTSTAKLTVGSWDNGGTATGLAGFELANMKIGKNHTTAVPIITIGSAALVTAGFRPIDTWFHHMGTVQLQVPASVAPDVSDFGTDTRCDSVVCGDPLIAYQGPIWQQQTGAGALTVFGTDRNPSIFAAKAAAAGDVLVTLITGANNYPCLFSRTVFLNRDSSATMTVAVTAPDANQAIFEYCTLYGCTALCATGKGLVSPAATGKGVLSAVVYNPGIGINASAVSAA